MNYDLNSNRSLLKPFWGENDKSLKLETIKIIGKPSPTKKPFQGINEKSSKQTVQIEIRRVTFKLKLSKSKVLEMLKDKLKIDGLDLQNLYFFSLRRNVKIKKRRRK